MFLEEVTAEFSDFERQTESSKMVSFNFHFEDR